MAEFCDYGNYWITTETRYKPM